MSEINLKGRYKDVRDVRAWKDPENCLVIASEDGFNGFDGSTYGNTRYLVGCNGVIVFSAMFVWFRLVPLHHLLSEPTGRTFLRSYCFCAQLRLRCSIWLRSDISVLRGGLDSCAWAAPAAWGGKHMMLLMNSLIQCLGRANWLKEGWLVSGFDLIWWLFADLERQFLKLQESNKWRAGPGRQLRSRKIPFSSCFVHIYNSKKSLPVFEVKPFLPSGEIHDASSILFLHVVTLGAFFGKLLLQSFEPLLWAPCFHRVTWRRLTSSSLSSRTGCFRPWKN